MAPRSRVSEKEWPIKHVFKLSTHLYLAILFQMLPLDLTSVPKTDAWPLSHVARLGWSGPSEVSIISIARANRGPASANFPWYDGNERSTQGTHWCGFE